MEKLYVTDWPTEDYGKIVVTAMRKSRKNRAVVPYQSCTSDGTMTRQKFRTFNGEGSDISVLPDAVQHCAGYLRNHNVWCVVSQNPPAFSCQDAADKRCRFGTNIPLGDELKSLVFKLSKPCDSPTGPLGYAAVHCRADQRVDTRALKDVIGSKTSSANPDMLQEKFGAAYGAVNPVLLAGKSDIFHIVDYAVLDAAPYYWQIPGQPDSDSVVSTTTMMTNAGHHEYAIEFRPSELFQTIPRCLFASVAVHEEVSSIAS